MLLSLHPDAVLPLSPHATPPGVGQHLDSARTGRQTTVGTQHHRIHRWPRSPPPSGAAADARPPRWGARTHKSAITTAFDARMPKAEQGARSSDDRDVRANPLAAPQGHCRPTRRFHRRDGTPPSRKLW